MMTARGSKDRWLRRRALRGRDAVKERRHTGIATVVHAASGIRSAPAFCAFIRRYDEDWGIE